MIEDFKAFPDIKKLESAQLRITQKIHGSNGQIYIEEVDLKEGHSPNDTLVELEGKYYSLKVGSRTRWLVPGNDNFGFAAHVYKHKNEFITKLGPGRHYGEWAGPGINSGEGLKEKTFVLFNWWEFNPERPMPPNTLVVPLLYKGHFDTNKINEVMADLKANGSKLVPNFMRPEGIVLELNGQRFKAVFDPEETQWKNKDPKYQKQKGINNLNVQLEKESLEKYGYLLQPLRLEKMFSRDEQYLSNYPKSLTKIVNDYFADLIKEGQIAGSELEIIGIQKILNKHLFQFIKESVKKQGINV